MTVETGRPAGLPIHATAVAIEGRGLLIRGASGAGKSALACALLAAATPARPIEFVGDDRVLLRRGGDGRIVARPHPRIAGFVERRGLGLVAMPWREQVSLAGCVAIGPVACSDHPGLEDVEHWLRALPALAVEPGGDLCRRVLDWWGGAIDAADRSQVVRKRRGSRPASVKLQLVGAERSI